MRKLQLNHNTSTFIYAEASSVYLIYKGVSVRLDCGINDRIEVYQDKENIYLYHDNKHILYAGLSVYDKKTLECIFELFYDNNDNIQWLIDSHRVPSKIRFLCQWWN